VAILAPECCQSDGYQVAVPSAAAAGGRQDRGGDVRLCGLHPFDTEHPCTFRRSGPHLLELSDGKFCRGKWWHFRLLPRTRRTNAAGRGWFRLLSGEGLAAAKEGADPRRPCPEAHRTQAAGNAINAAGIALFRPRWRIGR